MRHWSSLPELTQCLLLLMAHQESGRMVMQQEPWVIWKPAVCKGRSNAGYYSDGPVGHLPAWQIICVLCACKYHCMHVQMDDMRGPREYSQTTSHPPGWWWWWVGAQVLRCTLISLRLGQKTQSPWLHLLNGDEIFPILDLCVLKICIIKSDHQWEITCV